jgi:hypothetical protein
MRKPYLIDRDFEYTLLKKLAGELHKKYPEVNASNTLVINVSPDYSSMVSMFMAHQLSHEGEMCDLEHVEVPYPKQDFSPFEYRLRVKFQEARKNYKHVVLCEAGIIRGFNYMWITQVLKELLPEGTQVITTALCENLGSNFKSDVVGHYYDDQTQDLTFYFEEYNKHWD